MKYDCTVELKVEEVLSTFIVGPSLDQMEALNVVVKIYNNWIIYKIPFLSFCGLFILEIVQHVPLGAPCKDFSTMDSDKATSH